MKLKNIKKINVDFLLLWQGQFVSLFGDTLFSIAIGLWILDKTNSTIMMSSVLSVTLIFKIITSFFSGTLVDNLNRKKLIILVDIIRGIVVILLFIAIYYDISKLWMVYIVSILIEICSAFFNPAIQSSIPDIVDNKDVSKANANMNLARFIGDILGNTVASTIFSLISFPVLILVNGISYIYSALSTIFIKIPHKDKNHDFITLKNKLKEGYVYIWSYVGLRNFLCVCSIMNLFLSISNVLFLPLFKYNNELGVSKYGICMAFFTGGIVIGTILISLNKVNYKNRKDGFVLNGLLFTITMSIFPILNNYKMIAILFIIAGIFNSIMQNIIISSIQINIEPDMRGRVFSAYSMLLNILKPIGYTIGGFLGELISIRVIITSSFIITFIIIAIFNRNKEFKRFMSLKLIEGNEESLCP